QRSIGSLTNSSFRLTQLVHKKEGDHNQADCRTHSYNETSLYPFLLGFGPDHCRNDRPTDGTVGKEDPNRASTGFQGHAGQEKGQNQRENRSENQPGSNYRAFANGSTAPPDHHGHY